MDISESAFLCLLGKRLVVANPVEQRESEIALNPDQFLRAFERIWLQLEDGCRHTAECELNTQESNLFESMGIIAAVTKGSSALASAFGESGKAWKFYWLAIQKSKFLDYSAPGALAADEEMMRDHSRTSPMPEGRKENFSKTIILLHPSTYGSDSFLGRVFRVLFWTFGAIKEAYLAGAGPVWHRAVPSKGCLHPYSAYVYANNVCGLENGLWKYDGQHHALLSSAPCEAIHSTRPTIQLFVTVYFPRVQWRYRTPGAYKDIFLDLGHIRANLSAVCEELGVHLQEKKQDLADRFPPLVEDVMLNLECTNER